jgi:hypothetical protein
MTSFILSDRRLAWAAILAPLVWFLLIFAAVVLYPKPVDVNAFIIWAATSLCLLFSCVVVLWGAGRHFSSTVSRIQHEYSEAVSKIENNVRLYVDTSIVFRKTEDEMRTLLLPDLKRFFESSEEKIVILGADRLRPNTVTFNSLEDKFGKRKLKKENEKLLYDYGRIFNQILLPVNKKVLVRFIYLFSWGELAGRTPDFQDKYMTWLDDQVNYLRINQNYAIISTPRAPAWGAPKSLIFVGNIIAEVFFNGGGVVITSGSGSKVEFSDSVVYATRKALIDQYVDQTEKAPPRVIYTQKTRPEFEIYIADLRVSLNKLRTSSIAGSATSKT